MKNPLEITFHDLDRNQKIEDLILQKFEKLQKFRPDMTKCHVFIEKQSKHHHKSNIATIRLDIKVPRLEDVIVSEKCRDDFASINATVIQVFKRSQDLLREKNKYQRDRNRVARPLPASEIDVNDDEDVEV